MYYIYLFILSTRTSVSVSDVVKCYINKRQLNGQHFCKSATQRIFSGLDNDPHVRVSRFCINQQMMVILHISVCTHRFEMDDGAVGHDSMVSLHQVQLTAAVLSCFIQTVDRAALGAGADGHAGDGLITANTVYCSGSTSARLQLLEKWRKEQRERRQGTETDPEKEK